MSGNEDDDDEFTVIRSNVRRILGVPLKGKTKAIDDTLGPERVRIAEERLKALVN